MAVLLGVLAEFHAFQADASLRCWECTQGAARPDTLSTLAPKARAGRGELWNYSVDYFEGRTIERLDVAALGPGAPVPPGVSRLPGPGQYDVSPALAALLRTVPAASWATGSPARAPEPSARPRCPARTSWPSTWATGRPRWSRYPAPGWSRR